jgi:hypothetical protein
VVEDFSFAVSISFNQTCQTEILMMMEAGREGGWRLCLGVLGFMGKHSKLDQREFVEANLCLLSV